MAKKISKEELAWRAESDAETMARYEEIISDASRRKAAIAAAKEKAADLNKRADMLKKAAGTKKKK